MFAMMNSEKINRETHLASLVFWSSIEEKERIERWLAKLKEQGHVDHYYTGGYNPDFGEPVWYVP